MTQSPHGRPGSVDTETPPGDGSRGPVSAPADRPGTSGDFGEATITRPKSGGLFDGNSTGAPGAGVAPGASGSAGVGTVTSPPAGATPAGGAHAAAQPSPGLAPPPGGAYGAPHPPGPGMAPPPGSGPGGSGLPPRPGAAPPMATPSRAAARASGPRRARLQVRHVNPWTVLKFSCVVSVVLFFVWLIMIAVLYVILDASGVVGKINDTVTTINGTGSNAPITPGIVFGAASIVGVVNIVLFIALSTIGSVVYNLCADLVGGVEVTLSERETV